MDFSSKKQIHFIGIGGIGVSAIARMLLAEGKNVSGSDISESRVTRELEKLGAVIKIGHAAKNLSAKTDLVVYTNAISENNPEYIKAKKINLPTLSYPEALGLISKEKYTIAVAGTHGKTTTTAMVAKILRDAGFDPTVIVGSLLKGDESNFIPGKSKYFVVEADEYRRAFLNLAPKILVITNLDLDHMDYYKNLEDIQNAFLCLANKIPEDGFLVTDLENPNLVPILENLKCKILDYVSLDLSKITLSVPGKHNISNAKAALGVALALNVEKEKAIASLKNFEGTWRRFEFKGKDSNGALVYDDYAHNPEKIRAALQGAREKFPDKKIIAVFEPHLYSRTKIFLDEFSKSFSDADEVILLPIYAAREKNDPAISSAMLARALKKSGKPVRIFKNFKETESYLQKITRPDDVILTIGAGKITDLSNQITN